MITNLHNQFESLFSIQFWIWNQVDLLSLDWKCEITATNIYIFLLIWEEFYWLYIYGLLAERTFGKDDDKNRIDLEFRKDPLQLIEYCFYYVLYLIYLLKHIQGSFKMTRNELIVHANS